MTIITTMGKLQESAQHLTMLGQLPNLPNEMKKEIAVLMTECQKELDRIYNMPAVVEHEGLAMEDYLAYIPLPAHVMQLSWLFKKGGYK